MGIFSNNALTDAGRVLLAEVQMGAVFTPTKIVMGSGFLPSGTTARTITQVVAPVKTLTINKKQKANDGTVVIGGVYSNAEVTQDFYFRELALFAKAVKSDGSEISEVLYSYGNAGNTADLMPAYTTGTLVERQIDLATYIGNDTEIDLTLPSGIYVTFDDIEGINKHIDDKNNPHGVTAKQVGAVPTAQKGAPNGVAELGSDGKIPATRLPDMDYDPAGSAAAVQSNLNTHTKNKNNPHGVTAEQVGAIPTAQKGVPNGVAELGSNGKVPTKQLPDMNYDPAGSAAAVQSNLNTHIGNKNNPHNVTAEQVEADPAGSAAAVQSNLNTHIGNKNNPHNVTAEQVRADPAGSAAAVKEELQGEIERTSPKVGDLMMSYGDDPGAPWLRLNSGNNYITSSTPELYEKLEVERLSRSLKESLPTSELISTQARSMGYVNGYWYILSDSSYDPKLAFKKDGDTSEWQIVHEAAFNLTENQRLHLYYTYDFIFFDGKYYILGNNAIFSSENLISWECDTIISEGDTSNNRGAYYFHISSDGNTLYTFFGKLTNRWIVYLQKGGKWIVSEQINASFYELIMKPDGTMLGFDNGVIYSSPSITSTAFSKLCTIGKDFRYAEYEPHLDCYLCATTESTRYYAVKDFTADTSSADLKDVFARDFDYPTAGNIFYNTADKILWTLGATSLSSTTYDIHYAPAESFDTIGAPIVCSTSVSVRYMAYARVHQKDNTSIFTMNVSSSTASYKIYEFSKCLSLPTNLPPTYILTADLQNQP